MHYSIAHVLDFMFRALIALTSSSFIERPLLYEIMGGSKISFSSSFRHLLMSICFKLGIAEWNCVTKGKIHLGSFCFLARDCFLPSSFTSERTFSTKLIG